MSINPALQEKLRKQREQALRANRIFDTPVHHELVRSAREALLWHMSWQDYCALPDPVYYAYVDAWNEMQDDEKEASK